MLDKLEELAKAAIDDLTGLIAHKRNADFIDACDPETILRLVRVARAAKVILSHHDEGARPDQIALDELRAALKETT
jgi:hypothetical protein